MRSMLTPSWKWQTPLICQAQQALGLSFWHRHALDYNYDWGCVDVSRDGGVNWTQIKCFTGTVATWTQERVDLSTYKDKPLLIRFRLSSDGYAGNYDGWYIDDVTIKENDTQTTAFPFSDDFENGLSKWVVSGHDWGLTDTDSRGGSRSATDSPSGKYILNSKALMELAHPIDLTGATSPRLSFWHKHALDYNYDWGVCRCVPGWGG